MLITTKPELITDTLKKVQAIAGKSNDTVSKVVITFKDGTLSAMTTDTAIYRRSAHQIDVDNKQINGRALFPCKKLYEVCSMLPQDKPVTLSVKDDKGILKQGRKRYSFNLEDPQVFPYPEQIDFSESPQFTIDASTLNNAIKAVAFSMGKRTPRVFLNGVNLSLQSKTLTLTASDGHRLARTKETCETAKGEGNIIIPTTAIEEIQKMISGANAESKASIKFTDKKIRVEVDDDTLLSNLIDSKAPNYDAFIPPLKGSPINIDKKAIQDGIKLVGVLSDDRFNKAIFSFERDVLNIKASNEMHEEGDTPIHISYKGEDIQVGVNIKYMREAFSAISSSEIYLYLTENQNKDKTIEIKTPANPETIYVIMPMV